MESRCSVALVGRPNVGKSRLFNRLAGRRIAIVHDQPGVTRDVNPVEIDGEYVLMDTGGIGLGLETTAESIREAIEDQVYVAVNAADLILLVVDGSEGCTALDEEILAQLRRNGKVPSLVINKIDSVEVEERGLEFAHLGLEGNLLVSAEHGRGIGELRKAIQEKLGGRRNNRSQTDSDRIKICFAGRPNVGKSALCNGLLESERLIVNEVAGTTRDAVELDLNHTDSSGDEWRFRLVDTAGMRKRRRTSSSVEFFSSVRAQQATERADVVFLVLDALSGVTRQDKLLAGQILEAGRALVVVVNKWDLAHELFERSPPGQYEDLETFMEAYSAAIEKELFFLPGSPILYVSALKRLDLDRILDHARQLEKIQNTELPTPRVNSLIKRLMLKNSPSIIRGKRLKVYYAVQVGKRPIRIRLFCNRAENLEDNYRRYLEHGFVSEFQLGGCPVRFEESSKRARK